MAYSSQGQTEQVSRIHRAATIEAAYTAQSSNSRRSSNRTSRIPNGRALLRAAHLTNKDQEESLRLRKQSMPCLSVHCLPFWVVDAGMSLAL